MAGTGSAPGSLRNQMANASETVTLVLDDASPLPESAEDVEDLALRLRGHIAQLAIMVKPQLAVTEAQRLAAQVVPNGYLECRVHLVALARATQALTMAVAEESAQPRGKSGGIPVALLRATVFLAVAAILILAAVV
ncbi:DUF6415 family natural product biosynthesis protein [Streptomyces sp. 372A]